MRHADFIYEVHDHPKSATAPPDAILQSCKQPPATGVKIVSMQVLVGHRDCLLRMAQYKSCSALNQQPTTD